MEQELVDKAISGDQEAFGELMNLFKEEGYKVAYMILRNEDMSIDAYLNAVEKAFKKIKQVKEPLYFKTWFMRIIINEAKNLAKQSKKVVYIEDYKEISAEEKDLCGSIDLEKAIAKVESSVQEMIRLKFYLGYTLEEVSGILHIPIGTVKGKMYGALKKLREELEVKGSEK